jgi:hypothetical protein
VRHDYRHAAEHPFPFDLRDLPTGEQLWLDDELFITEVGAALAQTSQRLAHQVFRDYRFPRPPIVSRQHRGYLSCLPYFMRSY